MIRWIRDQRRLREAKRQAHLAFLRLAIDENDRRLAELKRRREEPCPLCAKLDGHREEAA